MSFETTISNRPTLAPADFFSLPASVEIDNYTWHGSNIRCDDVLGHPFGFDDMRACGACDSRDVRCVFFHYFHHMVESDVRVELACNACGKFTVHAFERL